MSIFLVMQSNDGHERTFAVQKPTITIGRETSCDVRVPVPTVSPKHCQIHLDGENARLVDLRSERGTYHNGARVEVADLVHEDVLMIGPVTFVIRVMKDGHNGHANPDHPPEIVIERQENQTFGDSL